MAIDLPEHDLPRGDEAEEHGERSGFRAEGRLGLGTAAELAIEILQGVRRPQGFPQGLREGVKRE